MSADSRNPETPELWPNDTSKPLRPPRAQNGAGADVLLTIPELAELGAVSKTSIRRAILSGGLAASRIGRCVRVRLADWQAYLEAHRVVGRLLPVPTPRPRAVSEGARPVRPH